MLNGMDGNSRRTAASQPRSTEADERPETINIESVVDDVEVTPMMGRDLLQLMLAGARRIAPLVQTPFNERNGVVFPDGRWLAYESDSSGRSENLRAAVSERGCRPVAVSTAGGTRPLWAHSGTELFFLDGALMRLPVEATAPTWKARAPAKLFDPGYYTGGDAGRSYDVSSDDRRFLMIKTPGRDPAAVPPSIIVVQHFD
jgi:WD40-like Beta Propeller Repeat